MPESAPPRFRGEPPGRSARRPAGCRARRRSIPSRRRRTDDELRKAVVVEIAGGEGDRLAARVEAAPEQPWRAPSAAGGSRSSQGRSASLPVKRAGAFEMPYNGGEGREEQRGDGEAREEAPEAGSVHRRLRRGRSKSAASECPGGRSSGIERFGDGERRCGGWFDTVRVGPDSGAPPRRWRLPDPYRIYRLLEDLPWFVRTVYRSLAGFPAARRDRVPPGPPAEFGRRNSHDRHSSSSSPLSRHAHPGLLWLRRRTPPPPRRPPRLR